MPDPVFFATHDFETGKSTIIDNTPKQQVANQSQQDKKISGLTHLLDPLTNLLQDTAYSFFVMTITFVDYCDELISAINVVVYRLFHSSSFHPNSASFKKLIDQLEEKLPALQQELDELNQKFDRSYFMMRDIGELGRLDKEIQSTLRRLKMYLNIFNSHKQVFPIQPQVEFVKDAFQNLNDQLDIYCMTEGKHVLEAFKTSVEFFARDGIQLTEEFSQPFVGSWKILKRVLEGHVPHAQHPLSSKESKAIYSEMLDIEDPIKILEKQSGNETSIGHAPGLPLKLRNNSNSCYVASLIQAFRAVDAICKEFNQPIPRDPKNLTEYQSKLAVQKEILQFLNIPKNHKTQEIKLNQAELFLFLLHEGPSVSRLRETIFKSGLHPELGDIKQLRRPQDASNLAELFIDHFLPNCKLKWQTHVKVPVLPGLKFTYPVELITCLQVPLRKKTEWQSLAKLTQAALGEHVVRGASVRRTFDPQDGKIIQGEEKEAATVVQAQPVSADEFCEEHTLTELPPNLVIQFKRFLYEQPPTGPIRRIKREEPVILPQDGILDLTPYYVPSSPNAPKQARYRIKSMVRHIGQSLDNGHYVAEVELGGNYYHCDDTDPKYYKKISKTAFLNHKDAYMLVLERIDDEKQEVEKTKKTKKNAPAKP